MILGAMHQAVTAERDEIRLGVTPVGQCRRPLLRPVQIEDLRRLGRASCGIRHCGYLRVSLAHERWHDQGPPQLKRDDAR
jgi:hypothetical protein